MNIHIRKHYRITALLAVIMLAAVPILNTFHSAYAAASASFYLSPASQTVTTGSNEVVSIVLNTTDSINAVQSVFTYSSSNYSLVSFAINSSDFPEQGALTEASGSVTFSYGTAGGTSVTGTQTVATVTLHATGTGTSAMGLAASCTPTQIADAVSTCSAAVDSSSYNNDLTSVTGGTYTVNAVPVTPPVTPPTTPGKSGGSTSSGSTTKGSSSSSGSSSSGSGSSSSSGGTSSTSTSTATPTATTTTTNPAPAISGIKVSGVGLNSATITWDTNIAATSVVDFGTNNKPDQSVQSSDLTTTHLLALTSSDLSAGTDYSFVVISASSTGASSTSAVQQFTTLGYTISIRVVDAHGKLVKGAIVTDNGQSGTTNSTGVVTFVNMPAGSQTVTIKIGNISTKRSITVSGSSATTGSTQLQQFSLSAIRGTSNVNPLYYILTIVAIVAVTGGAILVPRNRLHHVPVGAGVGESPEDIMTQMNNLAALHTSGVGPTDPNKTGQPGEVITPSSGSSATDEVTPADSTEPTIIEPTDPPDSSEPTDSTTPPVATDPPADTPSDPPAEVSPTDPPADPPAADPPAPEPETPPEGS